MTTEIELQLLISQIELRAKCETNELVSRVLELNYARLTSMRMTNC